MRERWTSLGFTALGFLDNNKRNLTPFLGICASDFSFGGKKTAEKIFVKILKS